MSTRLAEQLPVMRKRPLQARSRATVEAIVEAGARILSEGGWAEFTTNKVAALAGVSIGSLYQYFPDKLSLVDAIRGQHLQDCLAVMKGTRADGLSPQQFAASLVGNMIEVHSIHPGLHRVLLDEAPISEEDRDPNSAYEVEYLTCYAEAVARYRQRQPTAEDRTIALIVSDAVDGVIHNAARRSMLADENIRRELVRLVALYLSDGAAQGPTLAAGRPARGRRTSG
ncbi:MAG: TetR/AcrR family transcriptional regulator [Rubrivivax sp.]